jgi:hypothetical protein
LSAGRDWLVLATRLVLLRSRPLLPESLQAHQQAAAELRRVDNFVFFRAAAGWLGHRT